MLAGILGALTGIGPFISGLLNPIAKITGQLSNAKIAVLNAKTDQDRIAANERVAMLQARLETIRSQPPLARLIDALVRLAFALIFIIYDAKAIVWDKVIQAGHSATDPLSTPLLHIEMMVVGFYFFRWVTQG